MPPVSLEQRADVQVQLREASAPDFDYFVLVFLSCMIATFGLLIDSAATIIGAMLVAPLMSPILGIGLASCDIRIVISKGYSIFMRSEISSGDHSLFSDFRTYSHSLSLFDILLLPFLLEDAAAWERLLALKALYPVFPLFRLISREIVLELRPKCFAISTSGLFFAKNRLISSRSAFVRCRYFSFRIRMILSPHSLH